MNPSFVVDCSMAMTWCFKDEATDETRTLFRRLSTEAAIVPAHWHLEIVNTLLVAEKRERITPAESAQFLNTIDSLDIEVDNEITTRAFHDVLPLARAHQLTSYDAAYLDLSIRRNLALASLDDDLCRAAKAVGVKLLGK